MPFLDLAQPQPITTHGRIDAVLADPSCSRWLKSALQMALGRDPVDAVNDAEVLHELLTARTAEIFDQLAWPPAPGGRAGHARNTRRRLRVR